ncbi:hypothetical protein P9016_27865, partial [Bacillus cereus]|nr:hypothetical protein [Bacillus cereus]
IDTPRKQQQRAVSPKFEKRKMSDENKDAMIQLLRDRIKEVEYENMRFVNVKINMYIFACLSMYKINHFLC